MPAKILILGGAKSGKSGMALAKAGELAGGGRKVFVATAQAYDREMVDRITAHQRERDATWTTVEEPLALDRVLREAEPGPVMLVDCLTMWLTNCLLHDENSVLQAIDDLIGTVGDCQANLILVANEVGLGIVPDNALARKFRDLAGMLNQKIARAADEVYFCAAGLSLKMK